MFGFNIEDAQILQYKIEAFISVIENEWESVICQWQDLKDCWHDSQCEDFEPLFDDLSQSYQMAIEDIYKYREFLQNKMIETEKVSNLELPKIKKALLNRWGTGEFTKHKVLQIPDDLKGLYYIYLTDTLDSQELETTLYIGKSEHSIKDKLLHHLNKSGNTNFMKIIISEQSLRFYWWESSNPSYEEALAPHHLQRAGLLKRQIRKRDPIVKYLDFD